MEKETKYWIFFSVWTVVCMLTGFLMGKGII